MRRATLALLLAAGLTAAAAAFDPAAPIPADGLRSDMTALEQLLQQSHPGLYRYVPQGAMDRALASAARAIDKPMDEAKFYGEVTALLAKVKDGHTRAFLSGDYRRYLREEARLFPVTLRCTDGRLFVVDSPGNEVPKGLEVLAINGDTTARLVGTMLDHVSGDADILTGKYARITDDFQTYYAVFFGRPRAFLLHLRDAAGKKSSATVMAMTQADLAEAGGHDPDPKPAAPPLRLEMLSGGKVAVMTLETFALPAEDEGGPNYAKFLATSFAELKRAGTSDLVIDLRGNDGGANDGPLLVSYLVDKPVRFYDSVEAVSAGFSLLHQYSHLGPEFDDKFDGHLLSIENSDRYRMIGDAELAPEPIAPQKDVFKGKVVVLIDGRVFSTAAQLCSVLRSQKRATFVGEETGGAYHGNASGELVVVTLPASKLKVTIPVLRYEMAGSDKAAARRGIVPDHPASPDDALAQALDLVKARPASRPRAPGARRRRVSRRAGRARSEARRSGRRSRRGRPAPASPAGA
ncbi:MAG TPA: S41 family peptidase [Candidatus Polarisedimenticolaceae bacterium]|nr:S41 family peptidase [Candidatus Polarisedimenticolaceae bacterium]